MHPHIVIPACFLAGIYVFFASRGYGFPLKTCGNDGVDKLRERQTRLRHPGDRTIYPIMSEGLREDYCHPPDDGGWAE
ncbi:MAG: hypothetical protein HPY68_09515 [Candidatus Atribacteria bacterium]|nr:hypothetical protein [Candidatus Atribacteria bacterium]